MNSNHLEDGLEPSADQVDGGSIDFFEAQLLKLVSDYSDQLEQGLNPSPESFAARLPNSDQRLLEMLLSVRLLHRATTEPNAASAIGLEPTRIPLSANDDDLDKLLLEERGRSLGDYRLLREIGRGAMGFVYEAEQIALSRRVAVKVLPPAAMLDERQIARFSLESQAAAKLHHPNIVPVYNVGCDRGIYFYSMQLIDCRELELPLEPVEVARIGVCVGQALHHAHQEGVIHRDIKPSNLLLDQQRKVWVTDFGLARLQKSDQVTNSGAIVGTMRYMSPEQACGSTKWIDHRTDIYALGVTLYEMLTGRCPYDTTDRVLFLAELERGEPTLPRQINPRIPVDLETIVLKAMSALPNDRYPTAADLTNDLERFLAGEVIAARRPSLRDRLTKWTRRNQRWVAVGVATWVLFTIGTIIASVQLMRAERQTRLANIQSNAFFSQARDVVDHFGISLSRELAQVQGAEQARLQVLRDTLRYYRDFIGQVGDNPNRKVDLASTHLKVARIAEQLGAVGEAIEAYQHAEMILLSVPGREEDRALCANSLGLLFTRCQQYTEADKAFLRAIAQNEKRMSTCSDLHENFETQRRQAVTLVNRASLQVLVHDSKEATSLLLKAETLQQTMLAHADVPIALKRTLLLDYAKTCGSLSSHCSQIDPDKSLELNEKAINHLREYCDASQYKTQPSQGESLNEALTDLVVALCNRGTLLRERGDARQAIAPTNEAVVLVKQLVSKQPENPIHRAHLVSALTLEGKLFSKLQEIDSQLSCFREAQEQATKLAGLFPGSAIYQINATNAIFNLGTAAKSVGERRIVEECIMKLDALVSEPENIPAHHRKLIRQRRHDLESSTIARDFAALGGSQ